MKTAEEVFLSVLEKELDFVAEDKLKSTARALVDRLGMWDVKFLDTTHDTMTVIKPEKTIDEYRAELAQTVQEKEQKHWYYLSDTAYEQYEQHLYGFVTYAPKPERRITHENPCK